MTPPCKGCEAGLPLSIVHHGFHFKTDEYDAHLIPCTKERTVTEPVKGWSLYTDAQIQEWAARHGITLKGPDLRAAFEDAATTEVI